MRRVVLPVALALGALGCRAPANVRLITEDPTVLIHGPEGNELGVATSYGIVFLGREVDRGRVEFTAWFGDGPSLEEGVVEAVGEELYTTSAEIRIPSVPISFETPEPGDRVLVRGRRPDGPWEVSTEVVADPRVEGLLLRSTDFLDRLDDRQLGAGVYVIDASGRRLLVGLISGRLRLAGPDGQREYLTAAGPSELWRLVLHRRNSERPKRWVYRDDIL